MIGGFRSEFFYSLENFTLDASLHVVNFHNLLSLFYGAPNRTFTKKVLDGRRQLIRRLITRPRRTVLLKGHTGFLLFFATLATCDVRLATCDLRRATCDLRLATCDLRLATCDLRLATCDLRLATCDVRRATCDLRLATCDLRLATCDLRLATCDLRLATCDLRLATCDLRLATCDLRLATCDLQGVWSQRALQRSRSLN